VGHANEPVAINSRPNPKISTAVEIVVSTKYLNAASRGATPRVSATSVMLASDSVSSPTVVLSRSPPAAKTTAPAIRAAAARDLWAFAWLFKLRRWPQEHRDHPCDQHRQNAAIVGPSAFKAGSIGHDQRDRATAVRTAVLRVSCDVNTRTISAPPSG